MCIRDRPVPAVNVVGKVVYHSEVLGNIASFIRTYWPVLLFVLAVGAVLLHVLRRIFRNPPKEALSLIHIYAGEGGADDP